MQPLTHDARRERRRQIAEDAKTMNLAELCEKYGVSERTVRVATESYGVHLSGLHRHQQTNLARTLTIVSRLIAGEQQDRIAADFGLTKQAVNLIASTAAECGFIIPSRKDHRS